MNFLKKLGLTNSEERKVNKKSIVFECKNDNNETSVYSEDKVLLEELQDLKLNKEKLERELTRLQKDNLRVYQGNLGLMEEINFLKYRIQETCRLHDEVVERHWNNEKSRKEYSCLYPFERIEVLSGGEVYTCCSGYVRHNYYIGNIYKNSFEEIWNSESAKKLRYSVTKGNFEFCTNKCKWLHMGRNTIGGETATLNPIIKRNEQNYNYETFNDCIVQESPKYITLTCDESCNLSCPFLSKSY